MPQSTDFSEFLQGEGSTIPLHMAQVLKSTVYMDVYIVNVLGH